MKRTNKLNSNHLTEEQKTKYFRLALLISGFSFDINQTETIWKTYEKILQKGKNFSVNDCIEIKHSLGKKKEEKEKETNLNWDSHLTKK